jgi:hypothetical protein
MFSLSRATTFRKLLIALSLVPLLSSPLCCVVGVRVCGVGVRVALPHLAAITTAINMAPPLTMSEEVNIFFLCMMATIIFGTCAGSASVDLSRAVILTSFSLRASLLPCGSPTPVMVARPKPCKLGLHSSRQDQFGPRTPRPSC